MASEGYPEQDDEAHAVTTRRRCLGRAESESDTYDDFVSDGEEGPGGRFRIVRVLVAVLALVAFAAVTWYAYNWGIASREPQELVVIQAEATPEKERPVEEGGMEVPHQDKLLLNEIAPDNPQPKIERLLPPPEMPKPPAAAAAPDPIAGGESALSSSADATTSAVPQADDEAVAGVSEEQQPAAAADSEPSAPAAPAQEAPTQEAATEEAATQETTTVPDTADASTTAAPPAPTAKPVLPEPETVTAAPVAPKPPAADKASAASQSARLPAAGSYFLQLASVKSAAAANREWARLQKQFPSLLGRQDLTIEPAEVKGAQYHRIQTGVFASRDDAAALCAQLKAGGQDCLVRKR